MRMAALCRVLVKRHRITLWIPPDARQIMKENLPQSTCFRLPCIKTIYRDYAIDNLATLRHNFRIFVCSSSFVSRLGRKFQRMGVDVVISDYEPLTARAAGRARIPVLHVSHQRAINGHAAVRPSWFKARVVNAFMMRNARNCITSSFYDGDVGPLLRSEITSLTPTRGDFVFVYARDAFREYVVPALAEFPRTKFRVFPSAEPGFAASLAACRGIIAPAGHQLMSEALQLKKPLLVFPQKGQYEQQLNARMLVRSGWGMIGQLSKITKSIRTFMELVDRFPLHEPDPRVRYCLHDDTERAAALVEEWMGKLAVGV